MATALNAGDVKRRDYFFVDPNEIIVKDDLRGRKFAPTEADIISRAISMLEKTQLQPVMARRVQDKKLQLVLGFTRTAAARLIRSGFEHEGVQYHDPEFTLKVIVADCNDKEALYRNIAENNERNACSDIDDAHNQNRMREHGDSDTDIAKFYGCSVTQVGKLRKLLSLSDEEQRMVHLGLLPTQVAVDLLDVDTEERAAIIAKCQKDNGKVSGSDVRSQLRDHHLADVDDEDSEADAIFGEAPAPSDQKPAKSITRSIRELKTYLNSRLEDEKFEDFHDVMNVLLEWQAGNKSDKQMDNAFRRLEQKKPSKRKAA